MKKIFLAWKDPKCEGVNPQWIELSAHEWHAMLQIPENKSRRFIIVDAVDWNDDLITIEATPEQYVAWKKEYNAKRYRWAHDQGLQTVSLDGLSENVVDEVSMDVVDPEEVAINQALCKQIPNAVEMLSEGVWAVLELLYIKKMSGRATAKELGISEATVRYRRDSGLYQLYHLLT